jgi:hypothetical protein
LQEKASRIKTKVHVLGSTTAEIPLVIIANRDVVVVSSKWNKLKKTTSRLHI